MTRLSAALANFNELMQASPFGSEAKRFKQNEKKFLSYTSDPKRKEDDPSGEMRKAAYAQADRARASRKDAESMDKKLRLAKQFGDRR